MLYLQYFIINILQILGGELLLVGKIVMLMEGHIKTNNYLLLKICYENVVDVY